MTEVGEERVMVCSGAYIPNCEAERCCQLALRVKDGVALCRNHLSDAALEKEKG